MELCLSLGDQASDPFGLISAEKPSTKTTAFCMGLSIGPSASSTTSSPTRDQPQNQDHDDHQVLHVDQNDHQSSSGSASKEVPVQLDLLPHTPVPRSHGFPWPLSQNGCSSQTVAVEEVEEVAAAVSSSPTNSGASSFHQMEIGLYRSSNINYRGGGGSLCGYKRDHSEGEGEGERACCRLSDEDVDINGNTCRKKLRLSKEQSAFLEETFKQHSTLNPKQKQALAKQLNLRARQVEVWFQNRRARTKLKQTEVDCEFLKRCCETLTEENRRLHKELQELRALKTSNSNPFYMQSPATTLTMCPSCERIATTNTATATTTAVVTTKNANINIDSSTKTVQGFPLNNRPRFNPFSQPQSNQPSAAS